MQIGIDLHIPHRKYQVKYHSFSLFSAGSATPIARGISSFVQVYSVNPLRLKAKFSHTVNLCKRILENIKLIYANKTKVYYFLEATFSQLFVKRY